MGVRLDPSTAVMRQRFGAWLKSKREARGLTQLDVAAFMDYGYPVIVSQIERGTAALPEYDITLWAEVLQIAAPELTKQYLYYCKPYVYEGLFGKDPYVAEKLKRSPRTVKAAPGRPPASRARDLP